MIRACSMSTHDFNSSEAASAGRKPSEATASATPEITHREGDVVNIRFGDRLGACPSCGQVEFRKVDPLAKLGASTEFQCVGCGDKIVRHDTSLLLSRKYRVGTPGETWRREVQAVAILESISDGFFAVDAQWRMTYVNHAAEQILDRPASEMMGSVLWDVYPGLRESEIGQAYRRVAGDRIRASFVSFYPDHERWYEVTASPANDGGLTVYFKNVTERVRARETHAAAIREEARREEAQASAEYIRSKEERLRLATDAAALGVWVWDIPAKRVTGESDRLYDMFGLPRSEKAFDAARLIGELVHPGDAEEMKRRIAHTIETGERFHFEGRFHRKSDNALRWIELNGLLNRTADGAPLRVVGTAGDISDRKQAQEELQRLAARLSEADRRRNEFIATLAHELRNPLAPLTNALHLMRMSPDNAENVRRARSVMERQLAHMVRLIDDLLDTARITNGKLELKKQSVELNSVVASAIEGSLPILEAAGHSLHVGAPKEPVFIEVDPDRLTQVVSNLLNNAAKYTPSGGSIEILARQDGDYATIAVADSGIGISAEALPTVFEMFTQVRGETDRSQGGLGIGLCLVRQLVQLHGGTVSASSPGAGKGSTFTVRLPLAACSS